MQIGEATIIFYNIENENITIEQKGEAIKDVLNMDTHNGITKAACLKVIDWLWNQYFEYCGGSE